MRIIGGRFRGKRLLEPTGRSVRPTSDRVRESLFNILDHRGLVKGARFLDLFCGTGAVGLEAYSRGAAEIWLMDQEPSLAASNISAFDNPSNIHLHHQRALARHPPRSKFDIAFLDPPYGQALIEPALQSLIKGWVSSASWIVAELSSKDAFEIPDGFFLRDTRRYGVTTLMFLGYEKKDKETNSRINGVL